MARRKPSTAEYLYRRTNLRRGYDRAKLLPGKEGRNRRRAIEDAFTALRDSFYHFIPKGEGQ